MQDVLDPDDYKRVLRSVRVTKAATPEIVDLLRARWAPEPAKAGTEADTEGGQVDGRPVRRTVGKSAVRRTGYFATRKNADEGAIAWESTLERDALSLLECDPLVTRFVTQPLTVRYVAGGGRYHYTPDLWFWRAEQPYVVEIKPRWHGLKPYTIFRVALISDFLKQFDIRFRLWLDDRIRAEPRLANARYLLRYRDQAVTEEQAAAVRSFLEDRQAASIRDIGSLFASEGREIGYALLLRGMLLMDPYQGLSERTIVRLNARGSS